MDRQDEKHKPKEIEISKPTPNKETNIKEVLPIFSLIFLIICFKNILINHTTLPLFTNFPILNKYNIIW